MGVFTFTACDICGDVISIGDPITVVYDGFLSTYKEGRPIVTFTDEVSAEPLHHHASCHEATHVTTEEKGIVH